MCKIKKRLTALCLGMVLTVLTACGGAEQYPLDEDAIRTTTEYLCEEIGLRVTGTEDETITADWIEGQLDELGFTGRTFERTSLEGLFDLTSENLIAICNPDDALPLVSIVAHYDSVPTSVGAGDNAASIGILLEIARYLGQSNEAFPCEIRMVFLGSEENGYHGSRVYVEELTADERDRHVATYNMDISAAQVDDDAVLVCNTLGGMLPDGYVEGDFLDVQENEVSRTIALAYQSLYGDGYGGAFHMGESDQISFHNEQLDAANICWRQMEGGYPIVPAEYHKDTDTPDRLNYDTAVMTGRCVLEAISILMAE